MTMDVLSVMRTERFVKLPNAHSLVALDQSINALPYKFMARPHATSIIVMGS